MASHLSADCRKRSRSAALQTRAGHSLPHRSHITSLAFTAQNQPVFVSPETLHRVREPLQTVEIRGQCAGRFGSQAVKSRTSALDNKNLKQGTDCRNVNGLSVLLDNININHSNGRTAPENDNDYLRPEGSAQVSPSPFNDPVTPIPASPTPTLTPSPFSEREFEWDPAHLEVYQALGQGGFGTVHLAAVGERRVAVKSFHSFTQHPGACQESYERELQVLRRGLCHDNLVRLLGATCLDGWRQGARIVMEYAGCSTLQRILDDDDVTLDMYDRVMFGVQMVSGLQFLHDHGLVHLDLKPANMMFGTDGVLRLGDFGTCHVLGTPWLSHLMGTPAFRAPELFHKSDPTPAADVFSLGVTFWCMDTQQAPYHNISPSCIIFTVKELKLRPQLPAEETSDWRRTEYRALYTRCWADEVSDRPSLEEIRLICESLDPPDPHE